MTSRVLSTNDDRTTTGCTGNGPHVSSTRTPGGQRAEAEEGVGVDRRGVDGRGRQHLERLPMSAGVHERREGFIEVELCEPFAHRDQAAHRLVIVEPDASVREVRERGSVDVIPHDELGEIQGRPSFRSSLNTGPHQRVGLTAAFAPPAGDTTGAHTKPRSTSSRANGSSSGSGPLASVNDSRIASVPSESATAEDTIWKSSSGSPGASHVAQRSTPSSWRRSAAGCEDRPRRAGPANEVPGREAPRFRVAFAVQPRVQWCAGAVLYFLEILSLTSSTTSSTFSLTSSTMSLTLAPT